jgi:hypothetical protein
VYARLAAEPRERLDKGSMEEEAFLSSPAGHACAPAQFRLRMIRVAVAQTMITEPKTLLMDRWSAPPAGIAGIGRGGRDS